MGAMLTLKRASKSLPGGPWSDGALNDRNAGKCLGAGHLMQEKIVKASLGLRIMCGGSIVGGVAVVASVPRADVERRLGPEIWHDD